MLNARVAEDRFRLIFLSTWFSCCPGPSSSLASSWLVFSLRGTVYAIDRNVSPSDAGVPWDSVESVTLQEGRQDRYSRPISRLPNELKLFYYRLHLKVGDMHQ
ncbi:hypothetical protein KC19_11G144800 [Ceratodon purpureus]|uniref:Uncharacterized protein n=1 Tax=Ceratodon purpureus TaxID=3225 RepID=A0A8T0GEE7_CERPU|nr:hypothetical protein KC19_N027800 [Ceratodon purpureus]KAG0557631.1 hypothetical protein KC19_11G144800 [Ceratodon purpureus]